VLSATPQTPALPDINGLLAHLTSFNALLASSPVPVTLVPNVVHWEDTMAAGPLPRLHTLFSYWIVDTRGRATTSFAALVAAIGDHPGIDLAYAERNLREPAGGSAVTPDAETQYQDYVFGLGNVSGKNRFGVNANNEAVWKLYSGAGIGFVDIERGWRHKHQDFPPPAIVNNPDPDGTLIGRNLARDATLPGGLNAMGARRHGTASVSIAVGMDQPGTGAGIVGLAPGATLLGIASRVSDDGLDEWKLTAAILAACAAMSAGDVMLIEVETAGALAEGGYPVEVDWLHFDAIRLACANGFVVIEPAGNGWTEPGFGSLPVDKAHNLDLPIPARQLNATTPTPNLNRNDAAFTDSGAIMVASCYAATQPAAGHERQKRSSYGSRIDCYASGEEVYAADGDADDDYTGIFGGTSAASAIIAGVALLVQEMATQSVFPAARLQPLDLRAMLQLPDYSTSIYEIGGTAPIGVMPDLAKLAAQLVGAPDVFVRDAVGDDGSVPSLNAAQSPDIIVRSAWGGGDPDAAFGEVSGLAEQDVPNDDIVLNSTNSLFVRMRNRGFAQATGVVATVYWAETAPYIPPTDWHSIGAAAPVDVAPAGTIIGVPYGALKVAGPISWSPTAATLPVPHACFIALLDHPLDPAPPIAAASSNSWDDFFAFIRTQNNAAWRNFNVLPLNASGAGLWAKATFNINGTPDKLETFDIEVDRYGPLEHKWRLIVPKVLTTRLPPSVVRDLERYDGEPDDELCVIPIERSGVRLTSVRLLPRERHRCFVEVHIPRMDRRHEDMLSIAQIYEGRIVGRVSFVLTERSWRSAKST
jgi:hypothetical protein